MTIGFQHEGQKIAALSGGPLFKFSGTIYAFSACKTQEH